MIRHAIIAMLLAVASAATLAVATLPHPSAMYPPATIANMDLTQDPCNNFYEYACGTWIKNTPLPPSKPIDERAITAISDSNTAVLKDIILHDKLPKLSPLFNDCMDMKTRNKLGARPIADMLDAVTVKEPSQLMTVLGQMNAAGMSPVFSFGITPDAKQPTHNVAEIDQGGFTLPDRSYYVGGGQNVLKRYRAHINAMFKLAGLPAQDPTTGTDVGAMVINVETFLANASLPLDAVRDPLSTYHPMTMRELGRRYAHLDFAAFLRGAGLGDDVDRWNVAEPAVLATIDKGVSHVDVRYATAYLQWHVLHAYASQLSQPLVDETFRFFGTVLSGAKQNTPLQTQCIGVVSSTFGDILAKAYVARKFPQRAQQEITVMVNEIVDAFGANIKTLKWMDQTTKKAALLKLSEVTRRVGSPKSFRTYSNYTVTDGAFVATLLSATALETRASLQAYYRPVDRNKWEMEAFVVNAYYSPQSNSINFPAGILQPPYFNYSSPDLQAQNFGGAGLIMGHELSHGFDDQGRLYDGSGALKNWWSKASSAAFDKKTACLVDQYSKFEVLPGVFVNGNLTLGENIADNGGATVQTAAYTKLVGKENANLRLLWVSYAQTWCAKARPSFEKLRVQTDVHSPPKFRVLGPLMNLPAFAEEFECPAGSVMNPAKRCPVW